MHPDLEFAVISHRRKGMLLSRLSEVSTRGNLALVSLISVALGNARYPAARSQLGVLILVSYYLLIFTHPAPQ